MTDQRKNVLTIAAVTVATGVLAYAVYFDYKRRNDAQFRKKLRMSFPLLPQLSLIPVM